MGMRQQHAGRAYVQGAKTGIEPCAAQPRSRRRPSCRALAVPDSRAARWRPRLHWPHVRVAVAMLQRRRWPCHVRSADQDALRLSLWPVGLRSAPPVRRVAGMAAVSSRRTFVHAGRAGRRGASSPADGYAVGRLSRVASPWRTFDRRQGDCVTRLAVLAALHNCAGVHTGLRRQGLSMLWPDEGAERRLLPLAGLLRGGAVGTVCCLFTVQSGRAATNVVNDWLCRPLGRGT